MLKEVGRSRADIFEYFTLQDKTQNIVSLSILRDDYNYFERKCELVNQCILLSEDHPTDHSAAYFLPFYMQARNDVNLMKKKLEEATFLFMTVRDFYGEKMESEQMARFIIDFRARVQQFKAKRPKTKH